MVLTSLSESMNRIHARAAFSSLEISDGFVDIINCAGRIVSNTSRYSRISPVRKDLHWLPVKQRSIFKAMTLVYKFLNAGVPKYLGPYISP